MESVRKRYLSPEGVLTFVGGVLLLAASHIVSQVKKVVITFTMCIDEPTS